MRRRTAERDERVEGREVLDQNRVGPSPMQPDLRPTLGRAVHHPVRRGQEGADERPRHQGPAELFEHDGGVPQPQTRAHRLGQGEREHPGLAQCDPVGRVDHLLGTLP